MFNLFKAWQGCKQFNALPSVWREVVFYSESQAYWVHFDQIINYLTNTYKQPITYLTSQIDDPIFKLNNPSVKAFYIGSGLIRTLLFKSINARLMILTMPDLEKYHLKRSVNPVHYVYVFHSLVSTHMIYRKGAFDHYDTVLCGGPHHEAEIRETEQLYQLKAKNLVPHGYGRLDTIAEYKQNKLEIAQKLNDKVNVLIAPSWGKDNILASVGEKLIQVLLDNNFTVTIRPHPHALIIDRPTVDKLTEKYQSHPDFVFESNVASFESLVNADVLVTDWSGVAFDYAFGLERPVIFIDVPPKVNNPEYQSLSVVPIEQSMREQMGVCLSTQAIDKAPGFIKSFIDDQTKFIENIRKLRSETVYYFQQSGKQGGEAILALLKQTSSAS